ncbi:YkuD domain-containing protein [Nocardia nova SH22a]|uniref:YkuD domain-containing protein n=1 Tax=Nocardia nova SH22a TaxID=1415166 RepID=W5TH60_9NOCA|nr:Ig-like domain-containing protein [Nocardia nova]AHH18705.1 YkuD domain-containing protein [Nocardia nova SH22a]
MAAIVALAAGCGSSGGGGSSAPASKAPEFTAPATIDVPAADHGPLNPSAPIVVNSPDGMLTTVTVTDPDGKPVTGAFAADRHSWTSKDPLGYGVSYRVDAHAVDLAQVVTDKTFTVATIDAAHKAYANVVPAPDVVADTGIGVGQPMVFQFTAPVSNKAEVQKHLKISVTPEQPGAWYWVDDKDVHYRPAQYWQPGTKIHIEADVFGVDLGDGVFGAENNSADYTVHDAWVAKADGNTEQLTIFHNGAQVNQMPMSLGSPGFPSHEGPHVISEKSPSIVMDSCTYGVCQGQAGYYRETVDLDERISNDGEFVHSAPWSVGQQGSSNVSHGCVNLAPDNAQWFFDHFGIGDVVEITNSGGPTLPVWDTYGDWEVPWDVWQAGNANG